MQSFPSLLRSTSRILFLRGSPERIQIAPHTLPLSLVLAALGYVLAQRYFLQLSGAQVAVSLFCFIAMLACAMAWITRYVPRRRLSQALVAMLLMSAWVSAALAAVAGLPEFAGRWWLAAPLLLLLLYGLSHCLSYALRCQQLLGLAWCLGFAAVVYGLYALLDQQLELVFAALWVPDSWV